ncbi:histidine kinase N-terminal 7TM domain-containing protein [Paenibacillus beijingensis]|uniref:histidine kinase n=1 Tax=Paenibacillus beijingensis TaxID=1126833 RepID=A0A0D5NH16_9BACL|nr:histidine kinase N-terminal 7TM domain-containing protein [Paenibacillus beijingensis]AJY74664.1 hypothetical protein VN24_08835 [Paenibacillus beijingensis]
MNFRIYLFALLLLAGYVMLYIGYLSWKKRAVPAAASCALMMLAASLYAFGYAFVIMSETFREAYFWLRVEYVGLTFGSTLWLIMVLHYTGRGAMLRRWVIAALLTVPLLTLVLHYTNDVHHLFYRSIELDADNGVASFVTVKGPWYFVHITFAYAEFLAGMGLFLRMYVKSGPIVRKQIALLMIGAVTPYVLNMIYLTTGSFGTNIDLGPLGFTWTGFFYIWGIYRFNMLRLTTLELAKVVESMRDGVILLDRYEHVLSFNKAAARVIEGLEERTAIGIPAARTFARYPELTARMSQQENTDHPIQLEASGKRRFFDVRLTDISGAGGERLGRMLILSDVTETIENRDKLIISARKLKELNDFKDRLFSVVAHDIRDPLAVLINLTEFLEEGSFIFAGSREQLIREIGEQARNTFLLAESLLEWVRTQRDGMIVSPSNLELAREVEDTLALFRIRLGAKGVVIDNAIAKGTYILADKEMLGMALRNLLSNAVKFTEAGGSIRISAHATASSVIFAVSDTGVGMTAEKAETLFSKPVSASGTEGEKGVGLGLLLCREFVRLNDGEIWFESMPGNGSTFYVSVPAGQAGA